MSSLERTSGGYVVAGLPQTCLVNNLPPEIFDMVVAYVFRPPPRRGKGHVPLYATVCRRWQLAFERHSFRAIRLYSSQLDQFAEAFSSAPAHLHRRAALQTLRYNIILPTYTVTAAAKSERRRDWEANNTAFTQATRDLFRILHSWDRLGGNGTSTFRLDLSAFSPMDPSHRADKLPGIAARELVEDSMVDLDRLQRRFAHSYLSLVGLEAQPLPTAPHVGILTIDNGMGRLFEPHVAGTIAASLPALVKITWTLSDDEWRDPALRQVNRHWFAQSIEKNLTPLHFLTTFSLNYFSCTPADQGFPLPPAAMPSSTKPPTDFLSRALHALSQSPTLRKMVLGEDTYMVLSPELFWPKEEHACGDPFWPALQYFDVGVSMMTPFGRWYYERNERVELDDEPWGAEIDSPYRTPEDEDYGDEGGGRDDSEDADGDADESDEDSEARVSGNGRHWHFRRKLCAETFNPLVWAFARAVTRMPELCRFQLRMEGLPDSRFTAEWVRESGRAVRGQGSVGVPEGSDGKGNGRVWTVGCGPHADWEMPEGLKEVFSEGVGEGGEVRLLPLEL